MKQAKVIDAFRRVKSDIVEIQKQIIEMTHKQDKILQMILDTKEMEYEKRIKKKSKKTAKKKK
jgi:hypothetical protein